MTASGKAIEPKPPRARREWFWAVFLVCLLGVGPLCVWLSLTGKAAVGLTLVGIAVVVCVVTLAFYFRSELKSDKTVEPEN